MGITELLQNWNCEFRCCKRIFAEESVSREWEYNGVQRSTAEMSQLSVGGSQGKLILKEELEVSLRKLSV
jgi:hypothetical protein